MDTVKTIANHVERLPLQLQAEVLNFIEYIIYKNDIKLTTTKNHEWLILSREMENEQTTPSQDKPVLQPKTRRRILELRGLGKHLWQDVSVKDYINAERDSWNG